MRVVFPRFLTLVRPLAARIALAVGLSLLPVAGAAQTTTYDVGDRALVSIEAKQADILVKTWDRPVVQVETEEDFAILNGPFDNGLLDIPVYPERLQFGETTINLAPESFPVTSVPRMSRGAVKIGTRQTSGSMTVTVPASTAFIIIRANGGRVRMNDYRSGTFFIALRNGIIALSDVGGEGFLQLLRGHVSVTDSSFTRLRARTAAANMLFENCHARQIEASSVAGSIVYDNGSFEPGLARFDSLEGNVAVGVSGNGQIGARTIDGHIYTSFDRRNVPIEAHPNETAVTLGSATAPSINVSSARGNVFLYDGSMGSKSFLADEWQPMRQLYVNRHRIAGAARIAPRPQATRLQPSHPLPRPLPRPLPHRPGAVPIRGFRTLSR